MVIVLLLIAGFLLINPVLAWGFRKYEIQTEKLQFWVMVTTGTSWFLALVYFLLIPKDSTAESPILGGDFLPRMAFSHDWISAALIITTVGIIFATVLKQQESPQSNAWLAGLGGACAVGLETNTAYALGLMWTVVEGFRFYFSYRDQRISSNPRKFLPVVLLRISAPSSLILYSLTLGETERAIFSFGFGTGAGLLLIAAGLLGFLGWFLISPGTENDQRERYFGAGERWIPAILGFLLIIRGSSLLESDSVEFYIPLILSTVLIVTALIGLFLDQSLRLWFLSCGLLVSVAAIISGPEAALGWGLVMILPGLQLWKISNQSKIPLIPLIFAAIGLLPLPFLPSWVGVTAFSSGVPGILMGIGYGMLLGSVLIQLLKRWQSSNDDVASPSLLGIIGAVAILLSQVVISLKLDLIATSQDIFSKPVTIWISFLGVVPVLILGNHLPLMKRRKILAIVVRFQTGVEMMLIAIFSFVDRLVDLISRIFEGQGGLIWTLLIGLLLISLLSRGGG